MNCGKCGAAAGPNEQFCRNCGSPLSPGFTPMGAHYPMAPASQPSVVPGAIIAAIGLFLVAIAYFIGIGDSYYYGSALGRTTSALFGLGWLLAALGVLLGGIALGKATRAH